MNISNKLILPIAALALVTGAAGAIAYQSHAQTTTPATTTQTTIGQTQTNNNPRPRVHAPLGGDGNVTAINGTTITMQEEADEGGASYTVDASNATVTSNGATGQLSDIKVGDKIFVRGTTSGTNVTATSVSVGRPEGFSGHHGAPQNPPSGSTSAAQ